MVAPAGDPSSSGGLAVPGVRVAATQAGIRYAERRDLVLIELAFLYSRNSLPKPSGNSLALRSNQSRI